MNDDEEMSVVFGVLYFENPWLLSWLECIVLRGVDMARTLSEERLMRDRWIWRLTIKSAVSLDVMREGFSTAKACMDHGACGHDMNFVSDHMRVRWIWLLRS